MDSKPLNEELIDKLKEVQNIFDDVMDKLDKYGLDNEEYIVVKNSVETACFHAKKSMFIEYFV
jgi:hypothetical protein